MLYAASTFAVLAVTGLYLYVTLDRYLVRKDSLAVRDQIILLNHMLSEITDTQVPLHRARKWEERGVDNKRFQSRILDAELGVLAESPLMVPEALAFETPSDAAALPERGNEWTGLDGRKYILMSAWARSGRAPDQPKIIQVAFERAASTALLQDSRDHLIVAIVIASLVAAAIANWLVRAGMAPLRDVVQLARGISAARLHARLENQHWPNEVKELGTAMDGMLRRLEDSFQRLSQFSSDLAHELRTPIQNLMGEAEVALSRARTADEYRNVIESGMEEYQRLYRMIDSLLFLARADSPEIHIDTVELDLEEELGGLLEFYEALAEERGVTLRCNGKARLRADPILFRRAISNLLSNALRHTPRGGAVTVSAREGRGATQVRVGDNGTGIPSPHLPRIFDRFYRVDAARSNHSEGAGLGLAIVKSIMELHGGSVAVESTSRQGTQVTLTFPALEGPAVPKAATAIAA